MRRIIHLNELRNLSLLKTYRNGLMSELVYVAQAANS